MENELKQVVAELFEADLHQINEDFPLSTRRMQGSLARAKLDAAIRHRLGVKCRTVYSAKTYGELQNAVLKMSSSSSESTMASPVTNTDAPMVFSGNGLGLAAGLSCGIDIEMVENFPEVDDFWKDPFYTNSFSSVEIAYCLLQENPPMHFAARWCAKEALKKCQPSYLPEEMKNIELISNSETPPTFRLYSRGSPNPIPCAVSISHTTLIAIAVVIKPRHKK